MRQYGVYGAVIAFLYALNRFLLIPHTSSRFLRWHFADFLAGGLMLCILDAALVAAHRPPLRRGWTAALFALGCGLFWELVTPLYLSRSVGDPWDVVFVTLGGVVMWGLLRWHRTPN